MTGDISDFHESVSAETAYDDALSGIVPSLEMLSFPNPRAFVSGQIHENIEQWKILLEDSSNFDIIMD